MPYAYNSVIVYGDKIPPDVVVVECGYGATLTITRQGGGYTEIGRSDGDEATCSYHYYDSDKVWARALRTFLDGTRKVTDEAGKPLDNEALKAKVDAFIFGGDGGIGALDTTSVPLRRGNLAPDGTALGASCHSSVSRKHHTTA